MNKIAVFGATGTIGQAIVKALEERGDEVVRISRNSDTKIDMEDAKSLRAGLEQLGQVDAIVSAAGRATFGNVLEANDEAFELGIQSKLMGQVNIVRFGAKNLKPGGAVVLTSGILARTPWPNTSPVAMVNGALESFVKAAALDLEGKRVEIVSPPFVHETAVAMGMPTDGTAPASEVAKTYLAAIDDSSTGQTHFVQGHAPAV